MQCCNACACTSQLSYYKLTGCATASRSGVARIGTEVARAQELHAGEGSAKRCVVSLSPREARKKKFSLHYSDARMGSHGTFVVSWLTWRRTELALFVLTLLHGTWHCTVDKI